MTLRAGKNSAGFSLIELMLVLVLLGISSMITVPLVEKGIKNREARQAAIGLAAAARQLSDLARTEGFPRQLTLNLAGNSYLAARDHEIQLSGNLKFVSVEGGETTERDVRQFLFFPNGSNIGGMIRLGSDTTSYAIRLHPLTGRVELLHDRS